MIQIKPENIDSFSVKTNVESNYLEVSVSGVMNNYSEKKQSFTICDFEVEEIDSLADFLIDLSKVIRERKE